MTATALEAGTRSKRAARLGMFGQPIAAVVLVAAVLIWVFTQDLDAIEKQNLNAPVLLDAIWDHLVISFVVTALVLVIAVPLGIVLTRRWARRAAPFFLGIATIGQASPAIGILVLFFLLSGWEGLWAAVVPITFYSLLPVLRNTMVGLQQIDPAMVDAGRGIGMSAFSVLRRIELPLSVPLILAGLRTSLVHAVGVATMAVFVNGGGLGLLIDTGYKLSRITVLITGAVLAVALALLVDWLGTVAEQYVGPKGLR